MADMQADGSSQVDPLYVALAVPHLLLAHGGTNDLYFGATAAQTITRIQTYWAARQAFGWQTVAYTILPRSNAGTPGSFATDRATVNTWIRANWHTYCAALADLAVDPTIGPDGAETNPTYYMDLVHPTAAGAAIAAGIVLAAIAPLGLS